MTKYLVRHLPLRSHYYGCPKCRNCCFTSESADYQPLCPSYHHFRSIAVSGAGMNKLAANLFEGNIELSSELAKTVYRCTLCGGCDEQCPMSCRPTRTNLRLRRELVDQGLAPPAPLRQIREAIHKHHNPFGEPHEDRFRFRDGATPVADAEYVVFTGCHIAYRQGSMAQAAARVLDRLGIRYEFFAKERCCGYPLYQAGYEKEAAKAARKQFTALEKTGKKVLFLCGSCHHHLKLVRRYDLPSITLTELLADAMAELEPAPSSGASVTYHDPCALGRGCDIYDSPRRVLAHLGGAQLVEMPRNRENAWCCGAGADVPEHQPEFADWSGTTRIDEAVATGADTLVTSCPKCKGHLERNAGERIRVLDLVERVDEILADRS